MNLARVSSPPPRPANGGPAYLWWICIRMVLIFALAMLPVAAGGIFLLKGLHEKAMSVREAEGAAMMPPTEETKVGER